MVFPTTFRGCFVCSLINVAPPRMRGHSPSPAPRPRLSTHTCGPMAAGFPLAPAAGAKPPDVQSGISPKACHPNLRGLGGPRECCHAPSRSGALGAGIKAGEAARPSPCAAWVDACADSANPNPPHPRPGLHLPQVGLALLWATAGKGKPGVPKDFTYKTQR